MVGTSVTCPKFSGPTDPLVAAYQPLIKWLDLKIFYYPDLRYPEQKTEVDEDHANS